MARGYCEWFFSQIFSPYLLAKGNMKTNPCLSAKLIKGNMETKVIKGNMDKIGKIKFILIITNIFWIYTGRFYPKLAPIYSRQIRNPMRIIICSKKTGTRDIN